MTGCIWKLPDGRCDKLGLGISFCIGEACSSATPSNYDLLISKTPEELAKFLWHRDIQIVERASKAAGFNYHYDEAQCTQNVLSWLKSPANKEGDG